jgi:hypothetical protein
MKSLNLTSLYLTAYNVAAMVGWFMVLKNVVHHYRANDSAQVLWAVRTKPRPFFVPQTKWHPT